MTKIGAMILLLVCVAPALGQMAGSSGVLIRNVRVERETGSRLEHVSVLVVDSRVKYVGVDEPVPPGAIVIEGNGNLMTLGTSGAIKLAQHNVTAELSEHSKDVPYNSFRETSKETAGPTANSLRRTTDVVTQQVDKSGDLTQQAADPTAPLMAFTSKYEGVSGFYGVLGSGQAYTFQPVIPFRAWRVNHLLRTTVSYDISGPGERGLASVSIFDLIVFNKKWGRWGVGPLVSFTANAGPGRDTATAGPAIGFVARKGKWNLGLFNQNLFGHHTRWSSSDNHVLAVRSICAGAAKRCEANSTESRGRH